MPVIDYSIDTSSTLMRAHQYLHDQAIQPFPISAAPQLIPLAWIIPLPRYDYRRDG